LSFRVRRMTWLIRLPFFRIGHYHDFMRKLVAITVCGILALLLPGNARTQQKPGVEIKVVTYDGLKKAVRDQRGKVVVVDFWGEF
jgi:hypothetical protein